MSADKSADIKMRWEQELYIYYVKLPKFLKYKNFKQKEHKNLP